MQYNQEYFQNLLFEKIAGTISEQDDLLLSKELAANERLQKAWNDIQAKLGADQNRIFLENINENTAWLNVESQLPQNLPAAKIVPFYIRFKKSLAAAAILVFISTAVGIYLHRTGIDAAKNMVHSGKKMTDSIASEPDVIQLVLANGKVVNLQEKYLNYKGDGIEVSGDTTEMKYQAHDALDADQWSTLLVPVARDYKITLSDGSQVWLNSRSSIKFPLVFGQNNREVFVEGEAFFKVTHNPSKPFIVHAGSNNVQVLGTSFNVNTYKSDSITVSLVEGSVANNAGTKTVHLSPGMQSQFNEKTGFSTHQFDEENVLSWMRGIYYFREEDLKEISGILERWYNVEVVFRNKTDETHKLTGYINKKESIQHFIFNLENTAGIKCSLSGNKLYVQ